MAPRQFWVGLRRCYPDLARLAHRSMIGSTTVIHWSRSQSKYAAALVATAWPANVMTETQVAIAVEETPSGVAYGVCGS